MRAVSLLLCLAGSLFAQSDAPPKAPMDVKPGSITYEDRMCRPRDRRTGARWCCSMA
jgi:hypothetical protein